MSDDYADAGSYDENGDRTVSTWDPIDLGPYLSGDHVAAEPTMLRRTDGVALLYAGLTHSLHGESESGKSLVVQWLAVQTIEDGGHVAYLDHESDPGSIAERLLLLGASPEAIRDRFHYLHPETGHGALVDKAAWEAILSRTYELAVIDGVTDALGLFGKSTKDNDEIASWMRRVPRQLAAKTGAAVVLIDHVTKDAESRGRFAIGGQAKLAGLTGAAYTVEVSRTLARGEVGEVVLRVAKDRPGAVRAHGGPMRHKDRTQEVARIAVDSTGPVLRLTVEPPRSAGGAEAEGEPFRPTTLMERVSRWLESIPLSEPAPSRNVLVKSITGNEKALGEAADLLVREGYVQTSSGSRGAVLHRSVRPYRAKLDPRSDTYEGDLRHDLRPTSAKAEEPTSASPPGLGGGGGGSRETEVADPDLRPGECELHGGGLMPSRCDICASISEARSAS